MILHKVSGDRTISNSGQTEDRQNAASQDGFVQDKTYAGFFFEYKKLLNSWLNHDPAMFEMEKHDAIVDTGCGFGDTLSGLAALGFNNLTGIEPDATCREGATRNGLTVIDGTLESTNLPSNSFDVALVNNVFHHIYEYSGAVTEMSRILKPGGFLCFIEPADTIMRRFADYVTFKTPARQIVPPIELRYKVMKLELDTGLYQRFLDNQDNFEHNLNNHFSAVWHRKSYFFQFGKYRKPN